MGEPVKHIPVKLIAGLISGRVDRFALARRFLEKRFGKIDHETTFLDFSCTDYYNKELGGGLKRKIVSFKKLVSPENSHRIKLYSNLLEKKLSFTRNVRAINIDPGYLDLAKLILFTTKNRSHRTYLEKGIYADLELCFSAKSFRPLDWTYPDYRTTEYIDFFNSVRSTYATQIKSHIKK